VSAVAVGFAAWSWSKRAVEDPVSTTEVVPVQEAPVRPEVPRAPIEALHATRACLGRLELAQAALDRCEEATESSGDEDSRGPSSDPEVVALVEREVASAIEQHVKRERDLEKKASERLRTAFDEWSTQSLGILPHEREWLVEYVCAARELRNRTLDALDDVPAEQALEELREQRKQILADLEHALGPDRYATLRTIGGIGLLADTTDCSGDTAAG
jgi:hypothetical protein